MSIIDIRAAFVELPPFTRHREEYLDDLAYRQLQNEMMRYPEAGNVIAGTADSGSFASLIAAGVRASGAGCV
jgi:hypothetical protein